MSDTQQGPDWWLASDGKWYPPQSQPPPHPPAPPMYAPPQPPGYGYPAAQPTMPTSGKATAILVLGIVSLALMCGYGIGLIPAIVALSLAPGAKREIAASGGRMQGESFVKAGVICSWITVGIVAAAFVLVVVIAIISASSSSALPIG